MEPKPINPAVLPQHLARNTAANLSIESPRYIDPEYVYIREKTGELFLCDDDQYNKKTRSPQKIIGTVGIMRAVIVDPETDSLLSGFVADLRFIGSADDFDDATPSDAPDDQEDMNMWMEDRKHEVPIAAIAYRGSDESETLTVGDSRFAAAVLHLASLSDTLEAEIAKTAEDKERKPEKAPAKPSTKS